MQAVVKTAAGPGHVEFIEMPVPSINEQQVLIEVKGCGICGTDLHVYNDTFKNYPPVILGHEFYGSIIEKGNDVADVNLGESFSILGAVAKVCGQCVYCQAGEFMYCVDRRGMGHGVHGAFAKYAVARKDQLYRIPENIASDAPALVEPLAAAVHAALEVAQPIVGDLALVSGPGPIGLLIVKLLVRQGVRVIVAGASGDELRLEKANSFGAVETINVSKQNLQDSVFQHTDQGVDWAFEVAGAEDSVNNCLQSLRPLGSYIQVGHFGKKLLLDWDHTAFKQLQIKGSLGYTRQTWDRTLKILEFGGIEAHEIITHRLPLAEWRTGFELMEKKKAIKVILQP